MTESASSQGLPSPQHYEKIGRFVVSFEQVINRLRIGVFILLQEYGLEDDEIALAVTADLSANDILGIFRSTFGTYLRHNPKTKLPNVTRALMKRTQALLQRRNELLHSYWSDEVPENENVSLGYRFTRTREGLDVRKLPSLLALDNDILEAEAVSDMLQALVATVGRTDVPDLHTAFKFNENGTLYFDIHYAESIGYK